MLDLIRTLEHYNPVLLSLEKMKIDPLITITDLICAFASNSFKRGMLFNTPVLSIGQFKIYIIIEAVEEKFIRLGFFIGCSDKGSIYWGWKQFNYGNILNARITEEEVSFCFMTDDLPPFHGKPFCGANCKNRSMCFEKVSLTDHLPELAPTTSTIGYYLSSMFNMNFVGSDFCAFFARGIIVDGNNDSYLITKVKSRKPRRKKKREKKTGFGSEMLLRLPKFNVAPCSEEFSSNLITKNRGLLKLTNEEFKRCCVIVTDFICTTMTREEYVVNGANENMEVLFM